MPEPTVTEMGRLVYEALAPLAKSDPLLGYPLLTYCDALIAQAQPVRDQARDRGPKEPGWSILFNLPECPAYALDYLSQFAGADLTKLKRGVKVLARNEFVDPSCEYDTVGGAPYGYANNSSAGVTGKSFVTSEGWASRGKKSMLCKGTHAANTNPEAIGWITVAEAVRCIPVKPGQHLGLQMVLNIIKKASAGFNLSVVWYKADNATQVSTSTAAKLLEGLTGVQTAEAEFVVPEHAAFAHVSLQAISAVELQEVEFYTDELMAALSATALSFPLAYVDGDRGSEYAWVGIPGQSASVKFVEQTEEEFNELKRFRIKELKAAHRGMPAAIIAAAKQYLIGDQTVIMQERPGGNPWRLVVITYSEETPNEQLVKEAIEEQMPAGIVLEYKTVPGADWLVIRTEYTTWQQVKEAFATWGGVRVNKPGE